MIIQKKNEKNSDRKFSGHAFVLTLFCSLLLCGVVGHVVAANTWTQVGLSGVDARGLVISPHWTADHTMFVDDMQNPNPGYIYRTTDSGSTWQSFQPSTAAGYTYDALALPPDYQYFGSDQRILAGSSASFVSNDSGNTWNKISLPNTMFDRGIQEFAFSPAYTTDKTVFFVGNDGVFKSTDGGLSFYDVSVNTPRISGVSIAISPNYLNDQTVFWGGNKGIRRTIDGGNTWTLLTNGLPLMNGNINSTDDLVISPDYLNDHTVYAAIWTQGIYRSTDSGNTWTLINSDAYSFSKYSLAISPDFKNDNIIFARTGFHYGTWYGILQSDDRGNTWKPLDSTGLSSNELIYGFGIALSPDFANDKQLFLTAQNDGGLWKTTIQVNKPPLANAGAYWSSPVGTQVVLDGSGSTDPDGNLPLSYTWSILSKPAGSTAVLTNQNTVNPAFTTDIAGDYQVQLVVQDSLGASSSPVTVTITAVAIKQPPVADFNSDLQSGDIPLNVQFTDASTNTPTGWAWFFGDENYTAPWSLVNANAGWAGGSLSSSVVMPDGSIVLMNSGSGYYNDTWRSTDKGITWTLMNASCGWRNGRYGESSVALPDGSIVLMGGYDGNFFYNDTWLSADNGATWTKVNASSGWTGRYAHSSVAMPDGSIVLMGGYTASGIRTNDVWRSTDKGNTWTLMTANAGWWPRHLHSSVALSDGSIVLMGGYTPLNDVWLSVNNGASWTQQTAHAAWSGRYAHSSVAMPDDSIVLMGGYAGSTYKNDTWRSTDKGVTWTQLNSSAAWPARYWQTTVVLPDGSIILMGGLGTGSNPYNKNDVWRFIPAGSSAQNPSHTYTSPGTYSLALQAYNDDGYSSTLKVNYVTVTVQDTTPPVITTTPTPVPDVTGSITVEVGDAVSATYKVGDGAIVPVSPVVGGSITIPGFSADGSYTVIVTATDEAGNTATSTFTIVVDTTEPEITGPPTGPDTSGNLVVSVGDAISATYKVGDGAIVPVSPVVGGSITIPGFSADGSYTVIVTATDEAGNTATSTFTVVVDTTEPEITGPPTGPDTSGNLVVSVGDAISATYKVGDGAIVPVSPVVGGSITIPGTRLGMEQ